ncbi:LysM domain-containing protein [Frondihabitans australicus]|uniref:LysM domain-containing protein n=1 Tax=Frondihabitans australicus TaxID=386892 RepID=A0A495IEI6_9MICO|nr:LysM domain-containing protein [Frondihabitans australicus]RKR74189.1 hypothetical protein C8E83_1297 [Frondihabitans australicus]
MPRRRSHTCAAAAVATVLGLVLLAGCTTGHGLGTSAPAPSSTPDPTSRTLSAQDHAAIAAGRNQAAAENATSQPTSVATDTIQEWPAKDHGARANAEGTAVETSPGVYTYTVSSGDVDSVIALRFGLCGVDIVNPGESSGRELQPGQVITVERRMDQPDSDPADQDTSHEGWRCNYPG